MQYKVQIPALIYNKKVTLFTDIQLFISILRIDYLGLILTNPNFDRKFDITYSSCIAHQPQKASE